MVSLCQGVMCLSRVASFHVTLPCSTLGHFQFSLTNWHSDSHFGKLQAVLSNETVLRLAAACGPCGFYGWKWQPVFTLWMWAPTLKPRGKFHLVLPFRYGPEGTEQEASSERGFILLVFILTALGCLGLSSLTHLCFHSHVKWGHSWILIIN